MIDNSGKGGNPLLIFLRSPPKKILINVAEIAKLIALIRRRSAFSLGHSMAPLWIISGCMPLLQIPTARQGAPLSPAPCDITQGITQGIASLAGEMC